MTTPRDLITRAMKKAGIVVLGETPSAEEANDAMDEMNAMISTWSTDGMLIYARSWETFPLVSGTSTYTIGTGQTFNTTRPMFINEAYIQWNTLSYPLEIITDEAYNNIITKSFVGLPNFMNYDNGYPVGRLRFYAVPDQNYSVFLLTEKELSQYGIDDTISLPPGWEDAIVYNLAVRLAPEYGQNVSPDLVRMARDTITGIKQTVRRVRTMNAWPNRIGIRNVYTGWEN